MTKSNWTKPLPLKYWVLNVLQQEPRVSSIVKSISYHIQYVTDIGSQGPWN